ncbi:uncharacterized protein F4822DRAFT_224194 [Hypoxylon trugodes]|uniref:uncharacterized protein n=1 Tax=Hypoxylon trugodes TaxID=326681 RepID=UPI0021974EBD|nr:uncharacterized protein F4822DRAFT_224194 [Hypoxylon trugodes]KAI1390090.1 hypothetical protein F4822DRAFT_224194 [Hypoxylon trugodes]
MKEKQAVHPTPTRITIPIRSSPWLRLPSELQLEIIFRQRRYLSLSMDPGYLDRTPSREPPPGQESNFTNPESRSYQLYILIAVLSAVVFLVGSLRIYSRLRITRSFGVDDWLCIIATVLTLSYSALVLKLLWKPGGGILGIHFWDVPLSHYIEYQKVRLSSCANIRSSCSC